MRRDNYWDKEIKGWEVSGQTQKSYCAEHQLSYTRFLYWRNKLNKQSHDVHAPSVTVAPKAARPQWIPVTVETASPSPEYAMNLQLNQLQLQFTQQSDPAWIGRVINELNKVSL
ncbi:MAG: hypothetical protein HN344_08405 [Gammaproteobacteria bacterium]|jgi:hypothetical protein|nr:hypothetical protein [Gammaproteobacteria bacterium]